MLCFAKGKKAEKCIIKQIFRY